LLVSGFEQILLDVIGSLLVAVELGVGAVKECVGVRRADDRVLRPPLGGSHHEQKGGEYDGTRHGRLRLRFSAVERSGRDTILSKASDLRGVLNRLGSVRLLPS